MQLLEVKNDIAKILYTPSEKQLLLADFVLLEDINQSLICQIIGIESAENDNMNIATVRLSLSISKSSNLTTYNGYIPSKDSNVIYISPQEIAQLIKSSKTNLYWGKLSSHSEVPIYLGLNFLRDKAYIRCDSFDNSVLLNSNITYNLQFNKKRTVVFDSEGSFRQIAPVSMLTLGKDFKLPLDVQAFEFIASNDLSECSAESRAFIQGILIELEEYAKSLDERFIPFSLFKKVVDEQARFSSIPELMILRNKILRYEQAGIFAETSDQFKIFNEYLSKSTITTIDVSGVDEKYHKLAIKTVVSRINKKCYLIFGANDTNSDKSIISQIYENTNIRPVITSGYDYKYSNLLKSYCKNMVLFAPVEKRKEEDVYSVFLQKLRNKEFIIYGENTFYMPLVLRLEQFDKNAFEKLLDYEIKDDTDNIIFRANQSAKSEKPVIEITQEVKSEKKIYNALAPKTEPPKQEFGDIISQEIELTSHFAPEMIDDNPDDYIREAILQIPDEEFIAPELNLIPVEKEPEEPKQESETETVINLDEQSEEPALNLDDKDIELSTEPQKEEIVSEIKDEITFVEEPKEEVKDEITFSEEPELEIKDEITLTDEVIKPEILPEVNDEISFTDVPEEKTEITFADETNEKAKDELIFSEDKTEELSIIEPVSLDLTEPEIKAEDKVLSDEKAEGFIITEEPEKLQPVSEEVAEINSDTEENDDITDDDLDFLDECEVSDVEDDNIEEIPVVSRDDDNTIFEAYIENDKNAEKTPEEPSSEVEQKHIYKVGKVAYKARNDLKNMLDIPEITSDKYDFVESADALFGQAETFSFVKDEEQKAEEQNVLPEIKEEPQVIVEENPVIIEDKPDNTLIPDDVIDDEDLKFLDEMMNGSSPKQEVVSEPQPQIQQSTEQTNKLAEAIDEFKLDDSTSPVSEKEVQIDTTTSETDSSEINIDKKSEEVYVSSRITTDEKPVEIAQKSEENSVVQIVEDNSDISFDNFEEGVINLDSEEVKESMELASGISSSEPQEIIPIEFLGLTDDDISVLDASNSEVLQISDEDKNVDIYELQAASTTEEVNAEGLLENFIDVPENSEETSQETEEEEKSEVSEETENQEEQSEQAPEKPVVILQEQEDDEDEDEIPVVITSEEVITPPVSEEEEQPQSESEVIETALNSTLSQAVIQNIQSNSEEPQKEEVDELMSSIDSDEDEDSEDKLFADFSIDETPQVRKDKININIENIKANETPAPKVSQERRRTVEQSRQIPTPKQTSPITPENKEQTRQDIPVYAANTQSEEKNSDGLNYAVGDWVFHPKYGRGQVESFAHYSNKILFCTILFDNFGRRTLDARLTGLEKVK